MSWSAEILTAQTLRKTREDKGAIHVPYWVEENPEFRIPEKLRMFTGSYFWLLLFTFRYFKWTAKCYTEATSQLSTACPKKLALKRNVSVKSQPWTSGANLWRGWKREETSILERPWNPINETCINIQAPPLSSHVTNISCIQIMRELPRVPLFVTPWTVAPPGSSAHGIFQARMLEWIAISFSRESSWPRDQTHVSWIGTWILYHWTTWEAPSRSYFPMQDQFKCCLFIKHVLITPPVSEARELKAPDWN